MEEGQAKVRVRASFGLGSESYSIEAEKAARVSEELVSMKEKSMIVLKDYITRHNVPNEVPDELVEDDSSEENDDGNTSEKLQPVKSKKTKLT